MMIKKIVPFIFVVACMSFSQTQVNTPGTTYFQDVSPNGLYLAGIDTSGAIKLFNLSNNTTIVTGSKFADSLYSAMNLRWMPDGKRILCFYTNRTVSMSIGSGGPTITPGKTYIVDVSTYVSSIQDPHPAQKAFADISNFKIYPSPSTGSQPINFEVPFSSGSVKIEIANLQGSIVRVLYSENAADNKIVWDKKNQYGDVVPSGQYITRIISGKTVESKMVCITE